MKKKKTNILWKFFCLLLFAFIVLYISLECGYYETKMSKKTIMTNANIKRFEQDVKEGKQIDINSYIAEENKDYSNFLTKAGNGINDVIKSVFGDGLKSTGKMLKKLFT